MGLAFAATGALFPFFSAVLGWLGVAATGSDTSANVLFGGLQVVAAHQAGFNPVLMAAANSTGGCMGKIIAIASIVIAVGGDRLAGQRRQDPALCLPVRRLLGRAGRPFGDAAGLCLCPSPCRPCRACDRRIRMTKAGPQSPAFSFDPVQAH